jgi:hypothetical protein
MAERFHRPFLTPRDTVEDRNFPFNIDIGSSTEQACIESFRLRTMARGLRTLVKSSCRL